MQRPRSAWLGAISVWTPPSTLWDLAAEAPPVHLASPGDSVWWTTPALLEDIPVTTTTSCLSENAAKVKLACLCLDQAVGAVSACLVILLQLGNEELPLYRVIESIRLQGWSQCGLVLGLLRSKNASMSSQDWAQITFR